MLKDDGLHLTSYRMILIVGIFEEITLADLGHVMAIDGAQISRTAKELVGREYLEYRPVEGNLRKKFLAITDEGEKILAKLKPRFDARDAAIDRALEEAGAGQFGEGIDAIANLVLKDLE